MAFSLAPVQDHQRSSKHQLDQNPQQRHTTHQTSIPSHSSVSITERTSCRRIRHRVHRTIDEPNRRKTRLAPLQTAVRDVHGARTARGHVGPRVVGGPADAAAESVFAVPVGWEVGFGAHVGVAVCCFESDLGMRDTGGGREGGGT